jgi:hypothetical protein
MGGDVIVAGTGLKRLGGEAVLASIRRDRLTGHLEDLGLHLTNRRLIQFGRDRILWVFPSGRSVRSALIEDVDSAGVRTKRLPTWVLVLGLLLVIGGIAALASGSGGAGAVGLIVGIALTILWLFIQTEALVFSVHGTDLLAVTLLRKTSGQLPDDASVLLANYYDLKATTSPTTLLADATVG